MSRRPPVYLTADDISDLTELVPSPMPDSPSPIPSPSADGTGARNGYFAPRKPTPSHRAEPPFNNLALWLTRTQRYSAYTFTSFLGLHFTAVSLSPLLTPPPSPSLILLTRPYYQSPPLLEALLIPVSLTTHVLSGVLLRLRRHFLATARYGHAPPFFTKANFPALSVTGYLLVPLITLHATVTRVIPLFVSGDSSSVDLSLVAHGFNYHTSTPRLGWWLSATYYVSFVGIASWHVVHGFAKFLKLRTHKRRLNMIAACVAGAWLGGLAGVVRGRGRAVGYLGTVYDEYYEVFWSRIGLGWWK
ncbi:hypothetical protein BDZ91DRAFT_737615 [Kalaharituber pfeilii]|nr:hypothetical protein BDZ91DRAFT_737615 [Kalaharituber pfeilii]